MTKFPDLESYVEFIAGYIDIHGRRNGGFFLTPTPAISLARYDTNVVESLATQTLQDNRAYTDKQANLVTTLVRKYTRQLSKLGIEVPETLPPYRLGIREMDRSKSVTIEGDKICMRFPFDPKLIESIREQRKEATGSFEFDREARVWRLGMTEQNLCWAVFFAEQAGFDQSDQVRELYEKVQEVESQDYTIRLQATDSGFEIANASDQLISYINENLGGFGADNLFALVDNAGSLGYSVDPALTEVIAAMHGDKMTLMASGRIVPLEAADGYTLDDIVEYAKLAGRMPAYVYDTQTLPSHRREDLIYLKRSVNIDTPPKLLITTTTMMIGSRKNHWFNTAEKVIILT